MLFDRVCIMFPPCEGGTYADGSAAVRAAVSTVIGELTMLGRGDRFVLIPYPADGAIPPIDGAGVVLLLPPWPIRSVAEVCTRAAATFIVGRHKRDFLMFGKALDQAAVGTRLVSYVHEPRRHLAEAVLRLFEPPAVQRQLEVLCGSSS